MSDQHSLVLRGPDDVMHGDDIGPKESTTYNYFAVHPCISNYSKVPKALVNV